MGEAERPVGVEGGVVSETGARAKVAVTVVFDEIVVVQEPVPEQLPPDQPEKVEPLDGEAVKVTAVPLFTVVEQVEPQEIPLPETVPVPVPDLETESV